MEVMDQTDESEALIRTILQMVQERRLKVRVYTKGRLHAKAYIFNYRQGVPGSSGDRNRGILQPDISGGFATTRN